MCTDPVAGRVAVVTGAAGLLGATICAELVRRGARVIALDTAAIGIEGAEFSRIDIADPDQLAGVGSRHRHVDWLIHAAAITGRSPARAVHGQLATFPLPVWQELLRVNVTGALVLAQTFLPQLRLSTDPAVLFIGSIQGLVPTLGTGSYGVTKAALTGLTRQLAAELGPERIPVNLLAPGPIAAEEEIASLTAAGVAPPTPTGRFGSPLELARAAIGIVAGDFRYMTGAVIPFDGGEHLRPRPGIDRPAIAGGTS